MTFNVTGWPSAGTGPHPLARDYSLTGQEQHGAVAPANATARKWPTFRITSLAQTVQGLTAHGVQAVRTNATRTPLIRLRQLAGRSGSARAGANGHAVSLRAIVRNSHHFCERPEEVAAPPRPEDAHRIKVLRLIARRVKTLSWTPALLALLLDELYVDDLYTDVVGDPETIPPHGYASAVAVAIALRHSWQPNDLAAIADRLGVLRKRPTPKAPPRGKHPLRTPP